MNTTQDNYLAVTVTPLPEAVDEYEIVMAWTDWQRIMDWLNEDVTREVTHVGLGVTGAGTARLRMIAADVMYLFAAICDAQWKARRNATPVDGYDIISDTGGE